MQNAFENKLNGLELITSEDVGFADFGRVIKGHDVQGYARIGKGYIPTPGRWSRSEDSRLFERVVTLDRTVILNELGTFDSRIDVMFGFNSDVSRLEWHASSELLIVSRPTVFYFACRCDLDDGRVDTQKIRPVLIGADTMVEIFSGVLHSDPCNADDEGFTCISITPAGTGVSLDDAERFTAVRIPGKRLDDPRKNAKGFLVAKNLFEIKLS